MSTMFARQAKLLFAEPCNSLLDHIDQPPVDLDPAICPIISTHYFGLRPIGFFIVPIVRRIESLREASNATP